MDKETEARLGAGEASCSGRRRKLLHGSAAAAAATVFKFSVLVADRAVVVDIKLVV